MNYLNKSILKLCFGLLFLAIIHELVIRQIGVILFYPIWKIYCFHTITTIIVFIGVFLVNKKHPTYTGYTFLVGTILQMFICIVFLIPLIFSEVENEIYDIFSFFIPFFICLTIEVFFSIKILTFNSKNN